MKNTSISIFLVLGILVFANLVSDQFFFRWDLTEDNQYSLSPATKTILSSLEETVTVKTYFSKDLPPNVEKVKKDFLDFLTEYNRLSKGHVVYQEIDPQKDEEAEKATQQAGIAGVMINVREKDQVKQQKAFLGITLELNDQKEVIPIIQPGAAVEYLLTTAIKKISIKNKPKVGLIQGHGEAKLEEIQSINTELSILYDVVPVTIDSTTTTIDQNLKTLIMVNPQDTINTSVFGKIDTYLKEGGNLMVALSPVEGDLQKQYGTVHHTGVSDWLSTKGLKVNPDFVADASSANINVQQRQGNFTINSQMQFPYFPLIKKFADHPVTKGLEAVLFQFVSSLSYTPSDSTRTFQALAFSSDKAATMPAPQYFDVQKRWSKNDLQLSNIPVAGVLTQQFGNGKQSRIIVVGSGGFAVNGSGQQQQRVNPSNLSLMVNSIDWLSDDTGLIELRTKGIPYRPLDELEDGTRSLLKWGNVLVPIILVLGYGLFRVQRNKTIRLKRMANDYEQE